jgi:acyl carrier protein
MNQIETETMASADTLIAVVEQLVRDTGHRRAIQVVLGSSRGSELVLDSLARVELVLRVEHAADLRANRPDLRITS